MLQVIVCDGERQNSKSTPIFDLWLSQPCCCTL